MKLLFVCTGNICRSPTAEGIFRHYAARDVRLQTLGIAEAADSAGLGDWHAGEPPDPRSVRAAQTRGYDISTQRARQIRADDFLNFDLLLAMDRSHLSALRQAAPADTHERIRLYLDFAPQIGRREVPDPYYGGTDGFELVLDLCEAATQGLIAYIVNPR